MKFGLVWLLSVVLLAGIAGQAATPPAGRPLPGPVRLVLPPVIYAVVGIEMNVYFDNVVQVINPDNYVFQVICEKGTQQSERWSFVPKDGDIGEVSFQLEVRNQENAIVARAQAIVKVLPANAGASQEVTLLCVGDSLTYQGVYAQHVVNLCQDAGNPRLTLIGSIQGEGAAATTLLEGAPGQTTEWFATQYSPAARHGTWPERQGSPFLYLGSDHKPKLDFARYCQDFNQGKFPDIVTFFLGICDINHPVSDKAMDSHIEETLKNYDILISMVRSLSPETRIGVTLIPPPAASQDAFGANYGSSFNRWEYKRSQHRLVERLIKHFSGREKDLVFLLPVYVNLDCRHNYPVNGVAWNARTTAGRAMQVNAVHPAPEGYRQIGDSFYCWLKAILSLSAMPLRFATLDNTVVADGLVRLRHEYRQERDQPLAFEAEQATHLEFQSANLRIMKEAQASGGFYLQDVKKLEFVFTVATPGSYQVRFRAWFPLKAPYNHRESLDDGEVRFVDDSTSNDPGVWFWTTGATYQLGRGAHRYLLPSPTAFCAGARLDKVVFLPAGKNDVQDFGPAATPILTPLTGTAMTERLNLRRIKAWQLDYESVPNGGTATVEYAFDQTQWWPVSPGKCVEVPPSKPQFIYFRFNLTRKEGQPSPWIQGVALQAKEETRN